jgi:hypothetical protein
VGGREQPGQGDRFGVGSQLDPVLAGAVGVGRRDRGEARRDGAAFGNLVRRIEKHAEAIDAAVELGLSNSRLEGIDAKIRLIQRRGYGFRNLDALTAAIYLCLGGVTLQLPTET